MSKIYPSIDADGLLEYSVVFTDRSLNHMSPKFQAVMRELHAGMTQVYGASSCVIVPGGGTFAMESVARQFTREHRVLVVRNGWFSYRWSQIFETGVSPTALEIAQAIPDTPHADQQFSPVDCASVCERIRALKPEVVVAPQVETSAGLLLPDAYLKTVADCAHEVGAVMVLDCVAAGTLWVDMTAIGIDVLITAPQKGWSSTPCAGLVMLSDRGLERLQATQSDSFALDLKKWHSIMGAYLNGGHAYHATLPTDGLAQLLDTYHEMARVGFDELKHRQIRMGQAARELLENHGFKSLAAAPYQASTVVVSHTDRDDIQSGAAFRDVGLQVAAGVPLACGESEHFKTFRIGLFGLDKLMHEARTLDLLQDALDRLA